MSKTTETALVPLREGAGVALRHALRLWAEASTAPSTERREELQGYKQRVVSSFFTFVGKTPGEISTLLRGLRKVAAEMSLTVLCYNLKRALKIMGVEELLGAVT